MANSEKNVKVVRRVAIIAVLMKIQIFCSVTPCRLVNSYRRFRGA
jgi:hypothetical protein